MGKRIIKTLIPTTICRYCLGLPQVYKHDDSAMYSVECECGRKTSIYSTVYMAQRKWNDAELVKFKKEVS
jgi:hypothetical protein